MNFFFFIFYAWDSLFHLLYSLCGACVIVLVLCCFYVYFQDLHSFIYSLYLFNFTFFYLFKRFICFIEFSFISLRSFFHLLFKNLYHVCKIGFKAIFLFFSYVNISRACCIRLGVLWMCHIALAFIDYVLSRTFSHLKGFGSWMFLL